MPRPLSPAAAIRLADYLQAHPERSVFWRSDTRVWVFSDDEEASDVTEVPEAGLCQYLDAQGADSS
jgi:hypothetical protein